MEMDFRKVLYYLAGVITLHYVAGWVSPILFTAITARALIGEHSALKAGFIGLIVNLWGVLFTMLYYPDVSWRMMQIVDEALFEFSPYVIPVLSILLPTMLYALAAYFNDRMVLAYQDSKNIN